MGFDLKTPSDLNTNVLVFTADPARPDNGGLSELLVPNVASFAV